MSTTINLKKQTIDRLKKFGEFQESWDGVINRLLDLVEKEGQKK